MSTMATPKAYSYVRFSSERQSQGHSLKRQVDKAETWAKENGLEVDTTSYRDLGVSAFKGKNVAEGSYLKAFIDAVEAGRIPKGSFLLVESLDRLTRQGIDDALELFLKLNRLGITIVDTTNGQQFRRDMPQHERTIGLMIMIMVAVRANEESSTKAGRLNKMWANKRAQAAESGKLMTRLGPIWLKVSADGTRWLEDKPKVKVMRELFDLAANGYGAPAIAAKWNGEGRPNLTKDGGPWSPTSINLLLRNRAAIGTYTPQKNKAVAPIPNYFPPIISETKFAQVQAAIKARRWVGTGKARVPVANLFTGISACASCGTNMRIVSTSGGKNTYLRCRSAHANTGCKEGRFPLLGAERGVLRYLADELSELLAKRSAQVEDPATVANVERAELEQQLENMLDLYAKAKSDTVAKRVVKIEEQLAALRDREEAPSHHVLSEVSRHEVADLFEQLKGNADPMDEDMRRRVQAMLRTIIAKVEFSSGKDTTDRHGKPSEPAVMLHYVDGIGGGDAFIKVGKYLDKAGKASRKLPRVACPHCGKVGDELNMKRWHFDKCKERKAK